MCMFAKVSNRQQTSPLAIMGGSRGGGGAAGPDPQNIGFPSNIDPDPLNITKLPSQHSMLGHYRHASETQFQWRFAGRPIIARYWWSLEPRSPKNI